MSNRIRKTLISVFVLLALTIGVGACGSVSKNPDPGVCPIQVEKLPSSEKLRHEKNSLEAWIRQTRDLHRAIGRILYPDLDSFEKIVAKHGKERANYLLVREYGSKQGKDILGRLQKAKKGRNVPQCVSRVLDVDIIMVNTILTGIKEFQWQNNEYVAQRNWANERQFASKWKRLRDEAILK